jgi:toxin ParE1/3/4
MGLARWTTLAEQDVESIALYIGLKEHRPSAAERVIDRILAAVDSLARHNTMGTPREDLGPGYRVFSVSRYVIVFKPTDDGVEIVRVVDGRRDLPGLFP